MDFKEIKDSAHWEHIQATENHFILFKHSNRCSLSAMVKNRLSPLTSRVPVYLLDVVKLRPIAQEIETLYEVRHESPQFLIIKDGTCIDHDSHTAIHAERFEDYLRTPNLIQ